MQKAAQWLVRQHLARLPSARMPAAIAPRSLTQAYAVQDAFVALKAEQCGTVVGHKIALGSPQMRAMVRYEAVITSVIDGILGIIIGAVFSWIIVKALEDFGFEFSISAVPLVVILIAAIVVGVIAALIPARRAARLNPLDALHQE